MCSMRLSPQSLGLANLSRWKEIMFRGYNRFIPTLWSMIRSRVLAAGFLCFFFLALSISVTPESCSPFERENPYENYPHIALGINLDLFSGPSAPFENGCSCSFPGRSCCMSPIGSTPKDSHSSIFSSDSCCRLSLPQAVATRERFDDKPWTWKHRGFHNFNSSKSKEIFLVNCTLLI